MELKSYIRFIKESIIYNNIRYSDEWKLPNSKVRHDLEDDIGDILLEIIDFGYNGFSYHIQGWIGLTPYVWIKIPSKHTNDSIDTIERIKNYLIFKGYDVSEEIFKHKYHNIFYIYFDIPKKTQT